MKRAGLLFFLIALVSCTNNLQQDSDVLGAQALAERVLGRQAKHFTFEKLDGVEGDVFELSSEGREIVIKGTNSNSMAVGLNHYLRYHCNAVYSWFHYDEMELPKRLPKVEEPVRHQARVKDRFFLNYCTYGYTMPWWKWEEWEHFIDWMAMNGVNMALAITGQESIWYQVWTEMGLTDEEVRAYFCGPAHLPWHRMINLDRWNGPLPKAWLDGQEALQKQIVARERELGIRPILPAVSGHVPAELTRIYPDAPIKELKPWEHFPEDCACSLLDPMSDLFAEIQKKFITKQTEIVVTEVLEQAKLKPGSLFVIGCSSSEMVGKRIGKGSSMEAAQAAFEGIYPILQSKGIHLAVQCCEHLNRALIMERTADEAKGYEIVNVMPQPHAGGSFAVTAWNAFTDPVAVEMISAEAGIDIGGTLIGMHLRRVAVPVRTSQKQIGEAIVLCARTRPKYIGGPRAIYQE